MGIFGALTTSVAGLQAQSYALENISGNIANSQTTAFKRIDTSFRDLIPDTGNNAQLAGSVTYNSRSTNSIQGAVQSASVTTYMAINGDGFFAVQKPGNYVDNSPIFEGVDLYTRRGDFTLDKNGYLVNGAGYYLQGIPIDSSTGNPVGSAPQVLQFQNDFLPSQQTSRIDYRANLASFPLTTKADSKVVGSEVLKPVDFTSNPRTTSTPAMPATDKVYSTTDIIKDNTSAAVTTATLLQNMVPPFTNGESLTFVVGNGAPQTITFGTGAGEIDPATATLGDLFTQMSALTGAGTTPTIAGGKIQLHSGTTDNYTISTTSAAWSALGLPTQVNMNPATAAGTGKVIGSDVKAFLEESVSGGQVTAYDGAGAPVNVQLRWAKVDSATLGPGHADVWNMFYQVDPNASGGETGWMNVGTDFKFGNDGQMNPVVSKVTLSNLTVSGKTLGDITMNFGAGGLTQFADSNGNVQINNIQQDGYAAGQLLSVSVSNQGRVVGTYSNGRNIDLAEVSVATFNGTDFLKRIDGGAFEATNESGAALYGRGGSISGSALEASNTDIADEFTKLIVTQQAYSANTKVITTANDMVQSLLSVVR